MKKVLDFLQSRGGLTSLWRAFADEPVSVRRAWLFTLGSAALAVFLVQFVSGFALALAYAPTPDHAWESVKAIQTRLFAGGLVRGLHHWGASAMVVLAVLHMARTFAFGAYRKPRELNWLVGLALLLLVLGFGFTGYLLPWDQKAYWATVVGTKVPAALPVVGPAASRLMAGGPAVGAATLTRFYALHVVLLPLLAFAFIAVHLLLLRRHSHAGPTTEPDPKEPFFPFQAARDGVVILAVILALFWLAARHPAPLERLADPTDTTSVPRPEWYFLPLFQLLKVLQGPARADRHGGSSRSLDAPPRARAVARPRRLAPAPRPPAHPRGGRRRGRAASRAPHAGSARLAEDPALGSRCRLAAAAGPAPSRRPRVL